MTFHKLVQADIDNALAYYRQYSERAEDRFWGDLDKAFQKIAKHPGEHHFDSTGLRRVNLKKYPYHVLYDLFEGEPRIWVVKHNKRREVLGSKRFKR